MSNVVDEAIVSWANAELVDRGLEPDAVGIRFGYWLGCYSSWTHDYSVTATVIRADGSTVSTDVYWVPLLEALPEYVAARQSMDEAHAVACYSEGSDSDNEIRFG